MSVRVDPIDPNISRALQAISDALGSLDQHFEGAIAALGDVATEIEKIYPTGDGVTGGLEYRLSEFDEVRTLPADTIDGHLASVVSQCEGLANDLNELYASRLASAKLAAFAAVDLAED